MGQSRASYCRATYSSSDIGVQSNLISSDKLAYLLKTQPRNMIVLIKGCTLLHFWDLLCEIRRKPEYDLAASVQRVTTVSA